LSQSAFELRHPEPASEEATLEEESSFFVQPIDTGGVDVEEIVESAPTEL